MTTADTVGLALRNLRQSKLRTALTTLGVAIGIASLSGMVSLGVGLEEQTVGRFMQSGVFDQVTVSSARAGLGRGFRGVALRRGGRAAPAPPAKPLSDDTLKTFAALPDVKAAYPNIRVPVDLQLGDFTEYAVVTGVPISQRDEGVFQTIPYGSFFANDTDAACLVTLDMAKRISDSDPKTLVGRALLVAYSARPSPGSPGGNPLVPSPPRRVETPYRIVGIVERDPGLGIGGPGISSVMIPLARAEAIDADAASNGAAAVLGLGGSTDDSGEHTYGSVTVKVTRAVFTGDVEDRIKALGYSAFSLNDALEGAKRAFILLDMLLSLIGSIALAVSSLGIVNTMIMSILERTREIGVMKAIGASDADIRRIFLIEASAIGILGGVSGIVLGWIVGRAINFGANVYIQSQGGTAANLFSLPWWLIVGALAFSWFVSLLAGSYPAARAARLDPIHALRHD